MQPSRSMRRVSTISTMVGRIKRTSEATLKNTMSAGPFGATRSKEIYIFKRKSPDKEYAASFKLNFYAESVPRAVWTKGQFAIDLDISIVDGIPQISGIKEKMLHQQKGKPNAAMPNSPTPANRPRYPYGISVPGRPGFVKSPYAPSKGLVDVRRYRKGVAVKCPFTGKTFITP
jgi:hypothetical protein